MTRLLSIIFLLIFYTNCLAAQNKDIKYFKPNVLLVMLNESITKIESYERRDMKEEVAKIKLSDEQTNLSIVRNFKKSFSFCPVYYFYSHDYDNVKVRKWEDITFYDADLLTSKKMIEVPSLGNYFIAEVNYPPITDYEVIDPADGRRKNDYMNGDENFAGSRDYCLLVYDEQFKLLNGKLGVTNISLRRIGNIFKPSTLEYQFSGADKLNDAIARIMAIAAEPEFGQIYDGTVVKVLESGAFVNYMPGRDGFIHISEIADERVEDINQHLTMDKVIKVKIIGTDMKGRAKLSMRLEAEHTPQDKSTRRSERPKRDDRPREDSPRRDDRPREDRPRKEDDRGNRDAAPREDKPKEDRASNGRRGESSKAAPTYEKKYFN